MNRPFDEELISAYLDDELSVEERRDVERILSERPEAQRLLDELRGIRDGLQALPAYRLQDDFGATVLRRAEREMLRPPHRRTKRVRRRRRFLPWRRRSPFPLQTIRRRRWRRQRRTRP